MSTKSSNNIVSLYKFSLFLVTCHHSQNRLHVAYCSMHFSTHLINAFFPVECFYSDNSILLGGDITNVTSTTDSDHWTPTSGTASCIDLCRNMPECKYWTVSKKGSQSKCQLKRWKGKLVKRFGYISGSLPSACCE